MKYQVIVRWLRWSNGRCIGENERPDGPLFDWREEAEWYAMGLRPRLRGGRGITATARVEEVPA